MIIDDIYEPQKSLYIIGGNILSAMMESSERTFDSIRLFNLYNSGIHKVSITYFYLGLDWLYLLNAIEIDNFGNIKLCS